jgi:chromosomal replication initiation ATPase DnaA
MTNEVFTAEDMVRFKQSDMTLNEYLIYRQSVYNPDIVSYIIRFVCGFYAIGLEDLKSKSHKRELVIARMIVAYILRTYGAKFKDIATVINRSKSGTLQMLETFNQDLKQNLQLNQDCEFILSAVKGIFNVEKNRSIQGGSFVTP